MQAGGTHPLHSLISTSKMCVNWDDMVPPQVPALSILYMSAQAFLLLRPSPNPILFQRCFLFSFAVRSVTGLTTARTASTKTF